MATILSLDDEARTLSYLNAYHCFGRSMTNIDTIISVSLVI